MSEQFDEVEGGDAPVFVIEVPVQLKRCGMAVRLVVRTAGSTMDPEVDAGLVALVDKALDWEEQRVVLKMSG